MSNDLFQSMTLNNCEWRNCSRSPNRNGVRGPWFKSIL